MVPFVVGLLVGGVSLVGCKKSNRAGEVSADSVRQSLDALKPQFAELKKRFMDLRERVETIPADFPDFQETRARFYMAEEARGVTDGKVGWLQSRFEAASSSGNRDELQDISKEIVNTQGDIRKIDELHTKMLHEIMRFQRMASKEAAAGAAAPSPTPPPTPARAKTKRSKSNP